MSVLGYIANLAHKYRRVFYEMDKMEYSGGSFNQKAIKAAHRRNMRAKRRR